MSKKTSPPENEQAAYKADIAAQCGRLLSYANQLKAQHNPTMPISTAAIIADIRALVERVITFEELDIAS